LSDDRSELTLVSFFDRRFPVSSIAGNSGDVPTNSGQRGMIYPVDEDSSLIQALLGQGQTTVISDAQHDPRLAPAHPILQAGQVGCLMLVPLLSQGKAIGLIGIATDQPERELAPDEVKLAETIAGQIAGAIETARLFEQVEKSAITEERNRLAHELHDAVTQTIFSASVIAEATPRIWHKDPALAKRNLDQLTSMLRGALAELRTMLLELRPDTIQSKSVGQLLQTVVDASQPRINAPISLTIDGDRILPPNVAIALHRVGQEALNNVGKHAEASQVEIKLVCHQSQVSLSIRDNGRGFDPQPARAGHFGLESMAERLETIGGTLSIDSKPGQGTVISAHWSEPEGRSPHE
jgi:two-component system nitrate/nitrite sensor histidine kinase NarX